MQSAADTQQILVLNYVILIDYFGAGHLLIVRTVIDSNHSLTIASYLPTVGCLSATSAYLQCI